MPSTGSSSDRPCPVCGYLESGACPRCGGEAPPALAAPWRGGLVEGPLALLHGAELLLTTPRTKRLLIPPLILTLVAFGFLFSWLFGALEALSQGLRPDGEPATGALESWLARTGAGDLFVDMGQWVLFLTAAVLALWLAFSVLYELIAGPFLDVIHGRIERRWFGPEPPEERSGGRARHWTRRGLLELRTLLVSARAALFVLVGLVLTFWVQFVPLIGVPTFFAIAGFTTAISLMDLPVSRRRWSFSREMAFVRRNVLALGSFGALASFLFLIPVVGPIFLVPVASVGGLWLFCRIDKRDDPSHGPRP